MQNKPVINWKTIWKTDREQAMYKKNEGDWQIDISGLRACAVWNARGLHERGIGEVNSFGSQLHGKDIQQLTFFEVEF